MTLNSNVPSIHCIVPLLIYGVSFFDFICRVIDFFTPLQAILDNKLIIGLIQWISDSSCSTRVSSEEKQSIEDYADSTANFCSSSYCTSQSVEKEEEDEQTCDEEDNSVSGLPFLCLPTSNPVLNYIAYGEMKKKLLSDHESIRELQTKRIQSQMAVKRQEMKLIPCQKELTQLKILKLQKEAGSQTVTASDNPTTRDFALESLKIDQQALELKEKILHMEMKQLDREAEFYK